MGSLLPKVLSELGLDQASHGVRLLNVWDEALGPELAPHCRPEGVRHGTLIARVPDSAWMQRLQLEKRRIMERLEELLGEPAAEDFRLRIGSFDPPTPDRGTRDRSGPSG
jgi:predicted nucleic acid-binding Zn ribbon protein